MSGTLLPCGFTLVDLTAALSTYWCTASRVRTGAASRVHIGAAPRGSPAPLQVQDIRKQRQNTRDNTRLTNSWDARSNQLLVMPTEQLTNWEWLPGDLLNGSECLKAWLVDTRWLVPMDILSKKPIVTRWMHDIVGRAWASVWMNEWILFLCLVTMTAGQFWPMRQHTETKHKKGWLHFQWN